MGWRLAEEVQEHAPASLTWRERYALVVFANLARNETRVCMPGVEDDAQVIARLHLSRSERYAVIAALVRKGALERVRRGQKHVTAEYRIPRFGPVQRLETPDPENSSASENDTLSVRESPSQRPGTPDPSPSVPSNPSSLSPLARLVLSATDATEDEAREIITRIEKDPKIGKATGYVRTLIRNGDIKTFLDEVRNTRRTPPATPAPAWCGGCDPAGALTPGVRFIEDDNGRVRPCPKCHPAAAARTA